METQENTTSQKIEYATPNVTEYGPIETLTQSGGDITNDLDGGFSQSF